MTTLTVSDARCAALFVSELRRSDGPDGDAVAEAASRAVRQFGVRAAAFAMRTWWTDSARQFGLSMSVPV